MYHRLGAKQGQRLMHAAYIIGAFWIGKNIWNTYDAADYKRWVLLLILVYAFSILIKYFDKLEAAVDEAYHALQIASEDESADSSTKSSAVDAIKRLENL